jgi:hypothetical protein
MSQCALGPGICHLFFARGGALPRFSCPTPGNCQLKEKKSANAQGGWAMLELTDALQMNGVIRS